MLLKERLEPIPSKRVTFHKRKDTVYVYYIVKAYRNKQGKPTSDEVFIGKKDNVTGKLIPHPRFYEIFPDSKPADLYVESYAKRISKTSLPVIHKIQSCGEATTMLTVADQIGLTQILQNCFPTKWNQMLTVAFYILGQSSTMMYIDDWFDETKLDLVDSIDGVKCSKLFSSISFEERQFFFTEWLKYRGEREYIAYDVTSISTYSQNMELAEWGYNRDNDKLPQLNCGMFYGVTTQIPVYYNIYSGSIPDKVCLEYTLTTASQLGIQNVCFIVDRGFVTKDGISFMCDNQYLFISAMPSSNDAVKDLIDTHSHEIKKMEHWIKDFRMYGVKKDISLYEKELYAHIYFSPEKEVTDINEYHSYIDKLEEELLKMNGTHQVPNRFKSFFIIEKQPKKSFTFKLDYDKINLKLKRAGYFILITNNQKLTSEEVLKHYRERNVIEEHFNQLKNGLEFKRLKTHCQKTSEGKIFIGFLALILRSYMLHTIKNNPETKKLTFEKVMIELKKIKSVIYENMKESLQPLTKLQKTLLTTFKVKSEILLC